MSEVTTYCSLWKLEILSRNTLYLTDHDEIIIYEGETYLPQHTADAARSDIRAGLSVDSGGVQSYLITSNLSAQEIRDGVLDGAQLSQYRHDWRSDETQLLSKGRVGEVSFSGDKISIEWLGQASLLDRSTGRVFSRQCDASFGDARCGLNLSSFPEGFPYLLGDDALAAGLRESDPRDGSSRYL